MSVAFLPLLVIFELIQRAALVNFMLFSEILKILKTSLDLIALLEQHSANSHNQEKQPPEVFYKKRCSQKFCKNFDLYFISKPSGATLLQTIVSYKNPFPVSRRKTEKHLPRHVQTQQQRNTLHVYLFLDFELQLGKLKELNNNNNRMKVKVKRAFKNYLFVIKKVIKIRQSLHEIFFNTNVVHELEPKKMGIWLRRVDKTIFSKQIFSNLRLSTFQKSMISCPKQ